MQTSWHSLATGHNRRDMQRRDITRTALTEKTTIEIRHMHHAFVPMVRLGNSHHSTNYNPTRDL